MKAYHLQLNVLVFDFESLKTSEQLYCICIKLASMLSHYHDTDYNQLMHVMIYL